MTAAVRAWAGALDPLAVRILSGVLDLLKNEHLVEVRGSSGLAAATYQYVLSSRGAERAREAYERSGYVGPAPVPLDAYVAEMRALAAARGYLDRERIRDGFSNLVVSDAVLEQLGPAVNAGKAVFLYGPPGNGKTVIAEGMGSTLGGEMYMPYAIDVEGHTITMFDPINHDSLETAVVHRVAHRLDPRDADIASALRRARRSP